MSAALVRQSLEVVDPDFKPKGSKVRRPAGKRYTVQDAKRSFKTNQQKLEENIQKLELIKKHSWIVLDRSITENIIQRAVTKRPIITEEKRSKKSKTVFTEEDFKKFEEEYLNSED